MATQQVVTAWQGNLWLRHGEGKAVLLHSPRPATKQDMRRAGLIEDRAHLYLTGCMHGTGYRGLYSRDYIVAEYR
jgi:hypothetical protein